MNYTIVFKVLKKFPKKDKKVLTKKIKAVIINFAAESAAKFTRKLLKTKSGK